MGDARFEHPYQRVAQAPDRWAAIQALSTEEIVMALAGAAPENDPLVTNILATEALNRTRRAEIVLDNIGEGIVALDAQRLVTYANPAALELLGYDWDELRGRDLHEGVHHLATGEPMPVEDCVVVECLEEGHVTYRRDHGDSFRRKDGALFAVELTCAPIKVDDEVAGAVLVISDITGEIEAELAMGRLAAVVEHSTDPIVTLGPDGTIAHANQAVESMLGYEAERLVGQHVLKLIPEEAHEAAQNLLGQVRRDETTHDVELPYKHNDGSAVATRVTAYPIYDRQGRVAGVSSILRKR